jgi:hypothetical protein
MSSVIVNEQFGLIREVAERLCSRGEVEREWFEDWRAEFDAVVADDDAEASGLLVDALIAFDRWQQEDEASHTEPGRRR